MQWNKENRYQEQPQQDVYADVKTAFSGNDFSSQDNQEFSLQTIQEKLGAFYGAEEQDVTSSSPDLMPSTQTINMSYQREYAAASRARAFSRLTTKQKVMIASYAIVVLALIIGISLCSVYVNGAFRSAMALDGQYVDLSSQIAHLNEQIADEDYDALMQSATELGYTEADKANTKRYTEVETRAAQNFHVQTNWFDSLCDWLCNAFGG